VYVFSDCSPNPNLSAHLFIADPPIPKPVKKGDAKEKIVVFTKEKVHRPLTAVNDCLASKESFNASHPSERDKRLGGQRLTL
jgi:hypothetical protein